VVVSRLGEVGDGEIAEHTSRCVQFRNVAVAGAGSRAVGPWGNVAAAGAGNRMDDPWATMNPRLAGGRRPY